MITIVFAHPWHGSFNHAILDAITHKLDKEELRYQIIDLSAEKFNPAMTTDDLRLYSKGETTDPLVQKYKKMLQHTDELIFIFPIWWGMLPASLKGFFDKVLLRGSAFNYDKNGNYQNGGWMHTEPPSHRHGVRLPRFRRHMQNCLLFFQESFLREFLFLPSYFSLFPFSAPLILA